MRRSKLLTLLLILSGLFFCLGSVSAYGDSDNGVTQTAGTAGCLAQIYYYSDCANGSALVGANGVALSPDGNNVYAVSYVSDSVVALTRDQATSALTQLSGTAGCISLSGTSASCAIGSGLDGAARVTVSPDGLNVYVAAYGSSAITSFSRNTSTGALTQLSGTTGCKSYYSSSSCASSPALSGAYAVAASPNGQYVYVGSYLSDSVSVFSRDATTGALTQLTGTAACVSETGTSGKCVDGRALDGVYDLAVTPDGSRILAASYNSDAIAVLSVDPLTGALSQSSTTAGCASETGTSGQCVDGKGLDGAHGVTISPDARHVYASSYLSDAVPVFNYDPTTGALSVPAGTAACLSETGTSGQCTDVAGIDAAWDILVSPNGNYIYVASQISDAVAVFSRNVSSGQLTQLSGAAACDSETGTAGTCRDVRGLDGARSLAMTADGNSLYTAAYNSSAVGAFVPAPTPYAPTCNAASASTAYGQAVNVGLSCSDQNNDALALSVVSQPANGTLGSVIGGAITYTPKSGFSGTDSFTYRAYDGGLYSGNATVTVQVAAPIPATCSNTTVATPYGRPVTATLNCSDPAGAALSLAISAQPADGSLEPIAGNIVTYTPKLGFSGSDSFTFKANNGQTDSAAATVTIKVAAPTKSSSNSRKGSGGKSSHSDDASDDDSPGAARAARARRSSPHAGLASHSGRFLSGKVKVKTFCVAGDGSGCKGTLSLLKRSAHTSAKRAVSAGASLGSAAFSGEPGSSFTVEVPLSSIGRKAASGHKTLSVHALATASEAEDDSANTIGTLAELTIVPPGSEPKKISGGRLADRLSGSSGADIVSAGGSSDHVAGLGGDDRISGGFGNDRLAGGSGNDGLDGGSGDDGLGAGGGDDRLQGGTGDDQLSGSGGNDRLDGGDGDDSLVGGSGDDFVVESRFGDDQLLDGGPGDDAIYSGRGNDQEVNGGDGNDLIKGGPGSDNINGDLGDDYIDAGAGEDSHVSGGEGDDIIVGGRGNDYLDGGAGNDILYGSTGSDQFECGDGYDVIYTDLGIEADSAVDCEIAYSDDPTVEGDEDPLDGIVNAGVITGGPGGAEQLGAVGNSPRPDRPVGSEGDDSLSGTPEHDTLLGKDGADKLFGLEGDDDLDGGDGNDQIEGGLGSDRIFGRFGSDHLVGGEGNDELEGGRGHDELFGGGGNDKLNGGFHADHVYGGEGDDHIIAVGGGKDNISCGPGNDVVDKDSADQATGCEVVRNG